MMHFHVIWRAFRALAVFVVLASIIAFGVESGVAAGDPPAKAATTQPAAPDVRKSGSAAELLQQVEEKPGFYSQMCGIPFTELGRFSPYAFPRFENRVSAEDFSRLRERRSEIVDLIRAKLITARKSLREAKQPVANFADLEKQSHDLAILIDLNGVEALEALCDWAVELEMPKPIATTTRPAESGTEIWPGALVVRGFGHPSVAEALSTITAILRQEGYQALLDSDIEKRYCEAVQVKTRSRPSPLESPAVTSRPIEPSPYEFWDDRCKAPTSFHAYCWIDMTQERRDQILGWARDYLKSTPPDKRRAAAGMSAWPILR